MAKAQRLANSIKQFAEVPDVQERLAAANQPGVSSAQVQAIFLSEAERLGFKDERDGLFANYKTSGLRPDYYRPLSVGRGVIFEVERGKTLQNNMDLLDFWKCHLCPRANYLFLLVPQSLRQNKIMSPRNEFATVDRRLSRFFKPHNYTNVRGLCLFGY